MELHDAVAHLTSLQATNDLKKATNFLKDKQDDLLIVHAAVMSGWTELVKNSYDIDDGDTVDEALDDGRKILHLAASSSTNMLRVVLLERIDSGLFEFDDEGYTPAMNAAGSGNLESLKMLVMAGADLDQVDPEFGRTALETACWQGNIEVLRYLLDAGADPTLVNTDDLEESTLGEEALAMIKEAADFREAMDVRRFKTIEVSMGAGEANFHHAYRY